jgi:Tfp pilus assembly protein PilF
VVSIFGRVRWMFRIVFTFALAAACCAATAAAQQTETKAALAIHLSRAKQLLAEQKSSLAIQEYETVLTIDPENVEAHANLGVILFFADRCSEASAHLTTALKVQPNLEKLQALLGVCQTREGNRELARANLERALPAIQDSKIRALIENNLVAIYYAEGNLKSASTVADDLLHMDPNNVDVLYMAYQIHTHIALAARNALAAIAPDSGRMHQMMAEHFINEGDAADAITQYEQALVKDPALPGVHYELAEALLQDTRDIASLEKAAALLKTALTESPGNASVEAKLGDVAALKNDPDTAQVHFHRALSLEGDQLDALEGLAEIETHKGNKESAVAYLLRASRIDPMDDKLHYRLSRLYRALDRKTDADREQDLFLKIRNLRKSTQLAEQRASSP